MNKEASDITCEIMDKIDQIRERLWDKKISVFLRIEDKDWNWYISMNHDFKTEWEFLEFDEAYKDSFLDNIKWFREDPDYKWNTNQWNTKE